MNKKSQKNKYLLFLFGSWLIAKLRLSLEISRMAFFKTTKKQEIRFVVPSRFFNNRNVWSFENDQLTFINYHSDMDIIILHRLSKPGHN